MAAVLLSLVYLAVQAVAGDPLVLDSLGLVPEVLVGVLACCAPVPPKKTGHQGSGSQSQTEGYGHASSLYSRRAQSISHWAMRRDRDDGKASEEQENMGWWHKES